MNQQLPNEEQIFRIARVIPTAAERSDYLKQVCGDNSQLFERMVALLKTTDEENSFLENPPEALAATRDVAGSVTEQPGTEVGPYKLLQKIGEGGFGVVYMAEQFSPVKRKVALKIIKPGMDSKEVIARFEAERQALALMNHPNIAKVFDGGTTDSGRPYFVMELVKGVELTEFCDKNRLTTEQRLKLFVQVCQAIQHAHQKGVIHRDIKPSNVMVTLIDNHPVPKVIDFGVAKAISQELTEKTMFTAYGQMIGTPQYMSPEQAQMSGLDIDTRSDVYSLGVLLYELLTGKTPLEIEQLRNTAYAEMQRLICEVEPSKPSTRVSALGDASLKVARNRGVDANKLNSLLRGDLDWIVMTALDKDRNRRYESAGNFAGDIERYLSDEPIQARPPSTAYKMNKFLRRNKPTIYRWAGAAVLMMVAGLAVFSLNWKLKIARNQLIAQAVDEALETLFGIPDETEAEKAVARAEAVGATGSDLEILKGRLEMIRNQPLKAIAHFENAIDFNPQGAGPRANLILATKAAGMESEAVKLSDELDQYPPISANDYFFLAEAYRSVPSWNDKNIGLEMIEESLKLKKTCLAMLVRSRIQRLIALNTDDASALEKALEDIENAAAFSNNERVILENRSWNEMSAALFFRRRNEDVQAKKHYEQAGDLIKTHETRGYQVPLFVRVQHADFPQTIESDREVLQMLESSPQEIFAMESAACYAVRISDEDAHRVLNKLEKKKTRTDDTLFTLAILAAAVGDKNVAEDYVKELLRRPGLSKHMICNALFVSVLLHDKSIYRAQCEQRIPNPADLPPALRIVRKVMMGTANEADVMDATDKHLDIRSYCQLLLAIIHLSDGDQEKARYLLEQSAANGSIYRQQRWARSILRLLDRNPNWLNELRGE